jgi:hypothetical protein
LNFPAVIITYVVYAMMADFASVDMSSLIRGIALYGISVYISFRWVYRIYFHPLAKFPGPKLAAATHLYEGYYDVAKKGRYIFEVEKMHKKYGQDLSLITFPSDT